MWEMIIMLMVQFVKTGIGAAETSTFMYTLYGMVIMRADQMKHEKYQKDSHFSCFID